MSGAVARAQVRMVIKDHLLLELLVTWLSPAAAPACALPCPVIAIENARPWNPRSGLAGADAARGPTPATAVIKAPGCCRIKLGLPPGDCGMDVLDDGHESTEGGGGMMIPLQVRSCVPDVMVPLCVPRWLTVADRARGIHQ